MTEEEYAVFARFGERLKKAVDELAEVQVRLDKTFSSIFKLIEADLAEAKGHLPVNKECVDSSDKMPEEAQQDWKKKNENPW